MENFGQNLIFEADVSILTPLAVSVQSLALHQPQIPVQQTDRESVSSQIFISLIDSIGENMRAKIK